MSLEVDPSSEDVDAAARADEQARDLPERVERQGWRVGLALMALGGLVALAMGTREVGAAVFFLGFLVIFVVGQLPPWEATRPIERLLPIPATWLARREGLYHPAAQVLIARVRDLPRGSWWWISVELAPDGYRADARWFDPGAPGGGRRAWRLAPSRACELGDLLRAAVLDRGDRPLDEPGGADLHGPFYELALRYRAELPLLSARGRLPDPFEAPGEDPWRAVALGALFLADQASRGECGDPTSDE